jgi:hypothetical protein
MMMIMNGDVGDGNGGDDPFVHVERRRIMILMMVMMIK